MALMTERPDAVRPTSDGNPVDPVDLLRAMLAISPEDAASAREDAAEAVKHRERPGSI